MTADETLNELLVKLFKNIMEIEGKSLITDEFKDLTYNDFHVIEAIGMSEPKSMSTVAKLMNVTTGTLTKAMAHVSNSDSEVSISPPYFLWPAWFAASWVMMNDSPGLSG